MADPQSPGPKEITLNAIKRRWRWLAWLVSLALIIYVFATTPFTAIIKILGRLGMLQVGLLLGLNVAIITLFGLRWWWILRTQGHRLPYFAIVRYRLAAFGVSYFTPGPQFGGEPLQVYYLRQNHHLSTQDALTSLGLDKLLELLANFTFLAVGLIVVFFGGYLNLMENLPILGIVIVFAILPWGYLFLMYCGMLPLTQLARFFLGKYAISRRLQVIYQTISKSESQTANYCQAHTLNVVSLMLVSGIVWLALVSEYWLALRFLGLSLDLWSTMVFITAARLAFLAPLPGGIGSLEFSQVLAAQTLGLSSELGASIGLLIRIRDISFGLFGLAWGGLLTRRF